MSREFIGRIPAASGIFQIDGGAVAVTVCPPTEYKHQKMILEGDVFPTTKERGKKSQLTKGSGKRRVVNFPDNDQRRQLSQNMRPGEFLLFTREPVQLDTAAD